MSQPRTPLSPTDAEHLERARVLAHLGWGHVHPNPMVGCVLVRDGRVVGEGHHARYGGPHAEAAALTAAGEAARGATAYVSLEPCGHHGQTPPCTEALLAAGVVRVVFGAGEPGEAAGGGGARLREAGIEVVGPVWDHRAARRENPAFHHAARHGTPFVALKLAVSLDGAIAQRLGKRTRLTGSEAEAEVHRLRSGFDAVMVGAGTVRADDPRLTVRHAPQGRVPPSRIVVATTAELPDDAALFAGDGPPVHVFVSERAQPAAISGLEGRGASVHPVPSGPGGVELDAVLETAWGLGIRSIFCEGGASLASSLLRERRVGRYYHLMAPLTLGTRSVPAYGDEAELIDWADFEPAGVPLPLGRDTLVTFDRVED